VAEPVWATEEFVTVEQLLRARLVTAFGGWRGALESALPTLVFVVVWTVTEVVAPAAYAAVAAAAVLAVLRVVGGQTVKYVLWSVIGVVIAALISVRTGRAQDAFLPGLLQTAGSLLLFLVTNLLRWPLLGFLIAAGDPELAQTTARVRAAAGKGERAARASLSEPERAAREAADEADVDALNEAFTRWRRHDGIVRVASRLGWVFVGLGALRLAIQVPLYLAGATTALGVSRIVLGWPAYLVAVGVMALILLRGHTPLDADGQSSSARLGR
jgi:hypothetical protein